MPIEHRAEVCFVVTRDVKAVARQGSDQLFARQTVEAIAHRSDADVELQGQPSGFEPVACRPGAAKQPAPKRVVGRLENMGWAHGSTGGLFSEACEHRSEEH